MLLIQQIFSCNTAPFSRALFPKALFPRIVTTILILILAGCSFGVEPPPTDQIPLQNIALYYHRASLKGTAFEQFKLIDRTLYAECGALASGRYSAKDQALRTLDSESLDRIKRAAWLVRYYINELHATFKPAAANTNLFNPGKLTLSMQFHDGNSKMESSFDSVANGTEGAEVIVGDLVRAIRQAAGGELCGDRNFFGLMSEPHPNS